MNFNNQTKFGSVTLRVVLVLVFFALISVITLSLSKKPSFAVTYFDGPNGAYKDSVPYSLDKEIEEIRTQSHPEKSRAPEPGTIFLVLSGIGGVIVRFAHKSFRKFKRACDYFLAILGLLIASPIIVLAAIFIKFDSPGPVIYRQNRVGRGGKIFKIYKLRTMRVDAEIKTGAVWAKKNDSRVTSVGRFLRNSHIDEIPQLFNVIEGDMSIVGPRPERPEMVRDLKKLIHDYEKRLQVDPGITGLAQVMHKYDENIFDVRKKIKYDLLYIRKMCWLVEMRIMAQTCLVVLTGKVAG